MKEENKVFEEKSAFIGGEMPFPLEEREKKPVNLRVQKFLLLSAKIFTYTPKGQKEEKTAASLLFLDANDCDNITGQPNVVGKIPVLSAFVSELTDGIRTLEKETVFTPVFVKMSGNDGFIKIHDVLSPEQVEVYRSIIGNL